MCIKEKMQSKTWTIFLGILFFLVLLYILALNGSTIFNKDEIVANYFKIIGKNYTKSTMLKPLLQPPPVEQAEFIGSVGFMNSKKMKNRPRNTTDYEKGHRDLCKNSWQEEYTKLHQNQINAKKFITYTCPKSGWGNRLRDLIARFHFAVVVGRAFIINCDRPSPLDRYLSPRNIKWNYKINQTKLTVRSGYPVRLGDIKNGDIRKTFEKTLNYSVEHSPRLVGNINKWIVSHLRYNLTVWPNLGQMMGCSFYYLFKKSDRLEKRLEEWKEELGYYENIVLAIHIREGDSVFHHNRNDKRFKDPKEFDVCFECAAKIQKRIEEKYKTKKVIWFLAADSEKRKTYARTKYGNKVKYITGPIEHVGHPTKGNGDAGQFTMFLDYFLMQEADYRLYPGSSTFDNAVNFITLGTADSSRGAKACPMPRSLKV
ncbi:uncharacterized protein LOC114515616 [Dendronephthya gigantea]|uniref:uncharacterized protein LOC114515616 n=1 Tax=Dendronephthya gigantea TaxID=151771 RepID=UPI00106A7612|nr:uncharacterized protein LOC114515616 [Dendronephthya gigantea]